MANFAWITRSLKQQFLTPHIRKRKPRTGGMQGFSGSFLGNGDG